MNEDDIKQIVDRVLLTIKYAEEPEWNILYDYVTKLQNNWNELKKSIEEKLEKNKRKIFLSNSTISTSLISCENDGFMDKNTDYCSINCGVDEEIFKKCWDRYIMQILMEKTKE